MKERLKFPVLFFAFASLISNEACAESYTVELGWGNMTPCSRVAWRNDGIFGTPSPTAETADQRVYAYAVVEAPTFGGIQNDIQQCAVQGAAAAGLTAIIASPAGAMLGGCMPTLCVLAATLVSQTTKPAGYSILLGLNVYFLMEP